MNHGMYIAYDVVMVTLSISLFVLAVVLYILCKINKKPVESEETALAVKHHHCARAYSLMDIDAATDGFNHSRIVGKGHVGTVYAAVLQQENNNNNNGDKLVAVKRVHSVLVLSNAGFGFSSVLKWLSSAQHPNVVPIIGFSEAPGERIIVMEFGGMVSLDFYLHQNVIRDRPNGLTQRWTGPGVINGETLLDWNKRVRIAAGAARGIQYLHEVATPNIVHGCVKSSNVLIDDSFCARVCDYGLNFLAQREKRGLVGYVDDEYWNELGGGGASKESDVYGLGVVILELLSGRGCEEGLIAKWALPLIKELSFGELLDARLVVPSEMKPLVRLAKVASACIGNSRKCRPSMTQVTTILNSIEMEVCI